MCKTIFKNAHELPEKIENFSNVPKFSKKNPNVVYWMVLSNELKRVFHKKKKNKINAAWILKELTGKISKTISKESSWNRKKMGLVISERNTEAILKKMEEEM